MNTKIKLAPLQKKYFYLFNKWWNDEELRGLTSGDYEPIAQEKINEQLEAHYKKGFDFIILADKKPVGHIFIQHKKQKKNWEVYIAIGEKDYWGKGIGTSAMKKICQWFFRKFPKEKKLELEVNTTNLRAIRCYEKVGFEKIKTKHYKKYPDTFLMRKDK